MKKLTLALLILAGTVFAQDAPTTPTAMVMNVNADMIWIFQSAGWAATNATPFIEIIITDTASNNNAGYQVTVVNSSAWAWCPVSPTTGPTVQTGCIINGNFPTGTTVNIQPMKSSGVSVKAVSN